MSRIIRALRAALRLQPCDEPIIDDSDVLKAPWVTDPPPLPSDLPPAEKPPWERLAWLGWPVAERHHWVMAPSSFDFSEAAAWAHLWAQNQGGRAEIVALSSGDTLVRLARWPSSTA